MSERYDLIVVGAGPSGASTAYHAARSRPGSPAHRPARNSPRDKPCGDGHDAPRSLRGLTHGPSETGWRNLTTGPLPASLSTLPQPASTTTFRQPFTGLVATSSGAKRPTRSYSKGQSQPEQRSRTRLAAPVCSDLRLATSRGIEAENGETVRYEAPLVVAADGVGGFAGEGMKAHQNAVARRQYFKKR